MIGFDMKSTLLGFGIGIIMVTFALIIFNTLTGVGQNEIVEESTYKDVNYVSTEKSSDKGEVKNSVFKLNN